MKKITAEKSVADPDPNVFGPPGSGSIRQRYGSYILLLGVIDALLDPTQLNPDPIGIRILICNPTVNADKHLPQSHFKGQFF
jgi:hypothetical protein